jgi:hypothetical protein
LARWRMTWRGRLVRQQPKQKPGPTAPAFSFPRASARFATVLSSAVRALHRDARRLQGALIGRIVVFGLALFFELTLARFGKLLPRLGHLL